MFLALWRGIGIELVLYYCLCPTPPPSTPKWLARCGWNSNLESDLACSADAADDPKMIGRAGLPLSNGPGFNSIRQP